MGFVVLYDANVLYPSTLRDLLIRIADEVFVSLRRPPDLRPDALDRRRKLMISAVRDCLATGYEPLISGLDLPDPPSGRARSSL